MRRGGGFCGVVRATVPMLRAHALVRVDGGPGGTKTKRAGPEIHPNVGAVPYGSGVEETAAVLDVLAPAPGSADVDPAECATAGEPRGPALSPSRAADFMTCPLLYRFRVIDRLPEPPTLATARGTLVHAALERLFDLPAAQRTPEAARALLAPEWDRLAAAEPDLAALFPDEAERADWLAVRDRHPRRVLHPGGPTQAGARRA